MGIDLLLNVIAIAVDQEPDWSRAEHRIASLKIDDLGGYFAYWAPGEAWEDEANPALLTRTQAELVENLQEMRAAYTTYHREATAFDYAGRRFFVTGGLSVGEVPTSLYDPISALASVGALEAAGFDLVHVDFGTSEDDA